MHHSASFKKLGSNPIRPKECTLPTPAFNDRLEWIRQEILPHALSHQRIQNGHIIRLQNSPQLEATLDRLVELEAQCCSGLNIEHQMDSEGVNRTLRIQNVRGTQLEQALLAVLQAPKAGARDAGKPTNLLSHLLRAAGIGTTLAAALCCGVPAFISFAFGAEIALRFTGWDNPLAIATVALCTAAMIVLGFIALRKKFDRPNDRSPSSGCSHC